MSVEKQKFVRFEVPLSASRHAELEQLSEHIGGVSPRDLARLAIVRLLNDPQVLTGRTVEREAA